MTELQFVTNLLGAIRREERDGREYIVAPAVALVEGVLNGELAPAEEFGRYVEAWNGIPIPIGHPKKGGQYVSANRLDVQHVGRFYSAKMDGDKLKGEMWFDVARLNDAGSKGQELLEKLEANETIELSTGYWRDAEQAAGTFNGRRYQAIQRNMRPDHIAVLLDTQGACSVRDGCGVPRVNKEESMDEPDNDRRLTRILSANQGLSQDDVAALLRDAVSEVESGHVWVADVFPDDGFLVYELSTDDEGEIGLFRREYSIGEDGEVELGDPVEVFRRTTYVEEPETNSVKKVVLQVLNALGFTKSDSGAKPKETDMDELIEELVSNERLDFTEEELREMPESALGKIKAQLETNEEEEDEETVEEQPDPTPDSGGGGEEMPAWAAGLKADLDALSGAVEELQANVNAKAKQEKANTVARLVANEACPLGKKQLQGMELDVLKALEASYRPANYGGRGGFHGNDGEGELIEAPMPSINGGD